MAGSKLHGYNGKFGDFGYTVGLTGYVYINGSTPMRWKPNSA